MITEVDDDEAFPAEDVVLVKYASTATPCPDQFYALDINQMFVDTVSPSSPYISLFEIDSREMSSWEVNEIVSIPRSPKSTRYYTIDYYLNYHREAINEYHYYSYYDYGRLFTKGLFAMAQQSDALQFGMAAMSALIYYHRLDTQVKPVAFGLYSLALRELQELLDKNSLNMAESQIAMASAMQLSTFDVESCSSMLIVAFCWRQF